MSRRAGVVRCIGTIVGLCALYTVLPFTGDHWWLGGVLAVVGLAAAAPVVVHESRAVLSSPYPVQKALESTALLVVMLIIGFSAIYLIIDDHTGQFDGIGTRFDSIYFTVTTLSTVGFGDIAPVGQAARVAVTVQILFDLSVLAMAFRLLSTAARRALDQEREPGRRSNGISR